MGKYRSNTNKGLVIGLSAGGVVYVLIQLVHIIHGINQLNNIQQEDRFKNASSYIIFTDSAGKKDTQRLEDYLKENNPRPADSLFRLPH